MKFSVATLSLAIFCQSQQSASAFTVGSENRINLKLSASENVDDLTPKEIPKPTALIPKIDREEGVSSPEPSTVTPLVDVVEEAEPSTAVEEVKEAVLEPKEIQPAVDLEQASAIKSLSGVSVTSVRTNESVELSNFLQSGDDKSMLILGTYAADFNAIEYVQRLRYYLPQLKEKGVEKIGLVLNCGVDAAKSLVELLDLETDATASDSESVAVELFVDPLGEAGRKFGVGTGWRPEDDEMSPYVKLFGMLFGLGAWATLPAVIGGYIGNPFYGQPWIEDATAVGQMKGRWPNTALELDESTGEVKVNKFKELPYVGSWERRPLELATLRLQNMMDISIKNWKDLAPTETALKAGVLTQLGGCVVVDCK
eukprot:CAMPEP_0194075358 /NCGR_PEP_ID=MMETSP0149-20130528/2390_1 /TAXON_ID=122233 /ORGANISM="Chaetoceros debilis, Strain MM31A-1" /LENGTH=368 /DNA_ID=CAMNT_0038755815 /DNA_START=40 /DNA_END=1143 /DNA_ORIENTATION=-